MEEKIIGVEAVDNNDDAIIQEYRVTMLINGEEKVIELKNDVKVFQEIIDKYSDFLESKKKELEKDLMSYIIVNNIKSLLLSGGSVIYFLAIVLSIFATNSNLLLPPVVIGGGLGLGLTGGIFKYLEYIYDRPDLRKEFKKVEDEFKKNQKMKEQIKMAIIERRTIEKKQSVPIDDTKGKRNTVNSSMNRDSKRSFNPDRPSFLKDLNIYQSAGILNNSSFILRNPSDILSHMRKYDFVVNQRSSSPNLEQSINLEKEKKKTADLKVEVSKMKLDINTSGKDEKRKEENSSNVRRQRRANFNPDIPSFMRQEEYMRQSYPDNSDIPEHFKKR